MKFYYFVLMFSFCLISFADSDTDKAARAKMESDVASLKANYPGGEVAWQAAIKATAEAEKRALEPKVNENPEIQTIRLMKNGECLFPDNCKLPMQQFRFTTLSQVHRCGEVSPAVVKGCKCGKPWHSWRPKPGYRYVQKTSAASAVNTVRTAAQNYKP